MSDHPLVPSDVQSYIKQHLIEDSLNLGLNSVLGLRPADPLSAMAVFLIDVSRAGFS